MMDSAIGRCYRSSKTTQRQAVALGGIAVATDLSCVLRHQWYDVRFAFALIAFAGFVVLCDGDVKSLGLRLQPVQGWRPWIKWALRIGVAVGLLIAMGQAAWVLAGNRLPVPVTPPSMIVRRLVNACLVAPVLEETVYRLCVCVSLMTLLGNWKAIAVNGVLFAVLHVLYGTPSPENLFGGFFLAWAYLKSESIVVPVVLHSAGNAIAVTSQFAGWYFMQQSA